MEWQTIETAPKDGREQILLKVPYNQDGVLAWSNTWWISGFSAENKPTHWKPVQPSNSQVACSLSPEQKAANEALAQLGDKCAD